jgi:molybdopterin molybdotransferase
MPKTYIGFTEALELVRADVRAVEAEERDLFASLDAVTAGPVHAAVDTPSAAASLKDGYALRTADLRRASQESPATLKLAGTVVAGAAEDMALGEASAARILTGGRIPKNADAVVAEEFARRQEDFVVIDTPVATGRNILARGADLARGEQIIAAGTQLTPNRIGLLAAAGIQRVSVRRPVRVAIIASGDELILPGTPLKPGQLYASNLATLDAWCQRHHWRPDLAVVPDQFDAIATALGQNAETHDVILTSGGAWSGERDLMSRALEALGWRMLFHRVRLGPGKATSMGFIGRCAVFMLPGGPPSNLVGFLKLALPGILKIAGRSDEGLRQQEVRIAQAVSGQIDWEDVLFGRLAIDKEQGLAFQPDHQRSRLKAMAASQALLAIPEGVESIAAGEIAKVEILV